LKFAAIGVTVREPNNERHNSMHACAVPREQQSRALFTARHQRSAIPIEYKNSQGSPYSITAEVRSARLPLRA
jgi:hypothetical protein